MANTIMTITATDGLLSLKSKKEILTTRMILTVWLAKFENTHWKKEILTMRMTVWLAEFENTHWKKVKKKFRRRG